MEVQQRPPLPRPETAEYGELPQYVEKPPLPFRRTIRRQELHQIVPLAETTIEERKRESRSGKAVPTPGPDVRQRIARPVHSHNN